MTFIDTFQPILAALVLFVASTAFGLLPVKKLIQMQEAKRELKHGSAGFLRSMSGWLFIAVWLAVTWFIASVLGDWYTYGDLPAAIDRAWLRLRILVEILAALSDD